MPILLYFANIVFSVFQACWTTIHLVDSNALWVHARLRYVQVAFYSCSIVITFYTTCKQWPSATQFCTWYLLAAIIYRIIVAAQHNANATAQQPLSDICHILAQSGVSYALTRMLSLITATMNIEPQLLKSLSSVLVCHMTPFNIIYSSVQLCAH